MRDDVSLLERAGYLIEHLGADGRRLHASAACHELLGRSPAELIGRGFGDNARPSDRARVAAALADWRRHVAAVVTYAVDGPGEEPVWLESRGWPREDGAGFVVLSRDVSRQRRDEEQRERLVAALGGMAHGLLMYGPDERLALVNERFLDLYGLPAGALAGGMTLADVVDACRAAGCYVGRSAEEVCAELRAVMVDPEPATFIDRPSRNRLIAVQPARVPDGGCVLTFEDVTERQRKLDDIVFMAHHDTLTGLANRDLLSKRFNYEISLSRRNASRMALLCLDLDRFKPVNDSLGHSAGDALLQQVAVRLREVTRQSDTVARTGGDEFIIIQSGVNQPETAAALAQRLIEALARPFTVCGVSVKIGTSIGIAIYPDDGQDADELLRNADVALYSAKAEGRGRYCLYDRAVGEQQRTRQLLEADLRAAVGTPQMTLHYQPIIDCQRNAVIGFEALMRWTHPVHGAVRPDVFIPIAEEAGLINPLGLWALATACDEAATWPGRLSVAVNLSPVQFFTGQLQEQLGKILRQSGLLASRLELEVTEGLLITNTDQALTALQGLRALGIGLALDDFGTGYASLGYLQRFPFSRLKIDRSFVHALGKNTGADGIVSAILAMSRNLYLDVTAEGVETPAQLAQLRQHGCGVVQGFLFGAPMPAHAIGEFLRRFRTTGEIAG